MSLTVVETHYFVRTAEDIWDDEELQDIVAWFPSHYESGDVMRDCGGLRKIRAPIAGRGKSGGARVIYFVKRADGEIWLLAAYKKSVADTLPKAILKKLKELLE